MGCKFSAEKSHSFHGSVEGYLLRSVDGWMDEWLHLRQYLPQRIIYPCRSITHKTLIPIHGRIINVI